MNKFHIATLAVLCTLLTSCSKQELDFENTYNYEIESRSASTITVGYIDSYGNSQTVTCEEINMSYVSSTSVSMVFTYSNNSTQTESGNNITITSPGARLKVSTSPTNSFLSTNFNVQSCGTQCCYSYNNGNNVGTGTNFIVEEEPGGF